MSKKQPQVRARIRAKISGTAARPRLHVFVSNTHVRAQLIDDVSASTLVAVTTENQTQLTKKNLTEKAVWVAEDIAKKAKAAKVTSVVFDRGTRTYHGRVKAFAEAARKAGLEF